MIPITEYERKIIQKEAPSPRNRLAISSRAKNSGGKTYYVLCNDYVSLKILASIRKIKLKDLKTF